MYIKHITIAVVLTYAFFLGNQNAYDSGSQLIMCENLKEVLI